MKDGIRPRVETFSGICRCARMGRTRAAHSPLLARAQGKAPAAAVGRRNTVQIPKLVGDAGRTMHRVDLPERGGLAHGMAAPDQRVDTLRTEFRLDEGGIRQPAMMDARLPQRLRDRQTRSEEHTSELQSLMRISYAVSCLKKKNKPVNSKQTDTQIAIPI